MAGGTFDANVIDPKLLPGTYINFESGREEPFEMMERGTVLLPLFNAPYGPARKFINIEASESTNMAKILPQLGFNVYASTYHMMLVRQALLGAKKVLCYIPHEGAKATATLGDALTATAMYGGSRGNDLRVAVLANPVGGFDVEIYLGTECVEEFHQITTAADLIACGSEWITFAGTGDLEEAAGVRLAGGTDGVTTNADVMRFLDDSESATWTTMAFPVDANPETATDAEEMRSVMDAVASKITFLRDKCGRYRRAVVANYAANNENIVNVTNGVVLSDGTHLPAASAVAWVAGIDAGASNTTSNTYKPYPNAVDIIGSKTAAEAEAAIARGEFFFVRDDAGNVVVQKDINSLTDFHKPKDKSYSFNRVMRVFDTFAETVQLRLKPTKFDNSAEGYDRIEGEGQTILHEFERNRVIKNVDPANDFLVNAEKSTLDYAYIDAQIQPTMCVEKFYVSVRTL